MRLHFIAIGGSVMHSLAITLKEKGYIISGSDDAIYEPAKSALEDHELHPTALGWNPENVTSELDAVILGMHARRDNPELLRAEGLGIRVYSYPEFIFEVSQHKTRVVIAGSHGKTTITAMILHVMKYHGKEVDYLLGAALPGFERMLHLTENNDFMVIEGDEYLASAIDRKPKFHFYKPNIALLSGIAWDHMNVFPDVENYVEQFRIFIDSVVNGGILVYNEEDPQVKDLVEKTENPIRKLPYSTPEYHVDQGVTVLDTSEGEMPLEIFGRHNLCNLAGAKWICQHMGIDEDDFYEAIAEFKGAAKRLEKIFENDHSVIFKDFAHSPSKVLASVSAVKEQFPGKKLITFFELHTYSSLNSSFIKEYKNSLDLAEEAVVYYSPEALLQKKLPEISPEKISRAFGKEKLQVISSSQQIKEILKEKDLKNTVLLFMSSGNFGGIEPQEFIPLFKEM